MARVRYNNCCGTLGASLAAGDTTINFQSAPAPFLTLVSPDYIPLVIEPPSPSVPSANFEIVWLTAYTAGQTTGTIARGQEGTSGIAHSNGVTWMHGPTLFDIAPLATAQNLPIVTSSTGTGNLAATTLFSGGVAGLHMLVLKATGTNLDHHVSYMWTPASGNSGGQVSLLHDFAFGGTRVWSVTWGPGNTTTALGAQQTGSFNAGGNTDQVTVAAGGATTSWGYTLTRFSIDTLG